MRHIGGEVEVRENDIQMYFGHSGRAGLRMFCRNFPDRKILLPDFLCYIIVDILKEEHMAYDFYHIQENLDIDLDSLKGREFDVLFIINYYGKEHENLKTFDLGNIILLQDSVFEVNFHNTLRAKQWYGFSSLRKMTSLADGSIIKTNIVVKNLIVNTQSNFAEEKYKAKSLKYSYLHDHKGKEEDYLSAFGKAENMLDNENRLCTISNQSMGLLIELFENYENEKRRRSENYHYLREKLGEVWIGVETDFYSFFVIKVDKRDELRKYLFSKNIFLPIHWPFFGVENILYEKVLSIPVLSKYTLDDMSYIAKHIRNFLDGKTKK